MTTYDIHYMKPDWFIEGNCAHRKPDPTNLAATHVPLKSVRVEEGTPNPLEYIYHRMQGEVWSPNGEARDLIEAKGLHHTSMSVGDVIVDKVAGQVWVVAGFGFDPLIPEIDFAK